jgi:hypothetical protein
MYRSILKFAEDDNLGSDGLLQATCPYQVLKCDFSRTTLYFPAYAHEIAMARASLPTNRTMLGCSVQVAHAGLGFPKSMTKDEWIAFIARLSQLSAPSEPRLLARSLAVVRRG